MPSRRDIANAIRDRLKDHPDFDGVWTEANTAIVGTPIPLSQRSSTLHRAEIMFDGGNAFATGLVDDICEIRVSVRDHSDEQGDGAQILAKEGGLYGLCDRIAQVLNHAGFNGLCAENFKFEGFTRTDFAVDDGNREASAGVRFSFGLDLEFALSATLPDGGIDG